MNWTFRRMGRIGAIAACLLGGIIAASWRAETRVAARDTKSAAIHGDQPVARAGSLWDQKAAAGYLDQRVGWWMGWQRAARDHETFCVSCHTAVPYAISRRTLRGGLGEDGPSANERRLLENVTKRVRLWKEVAPFYSDKDRGVYKTVESRGTESVLNALILASNDASRDRQSGEMSADTRMALDNMWAEQQTAGDKKGAWLWLRFNNEPWEADDSDYYGATLAAVAAGTAMGNYRARPEVQENMKMLRAYLNREYAGQTAENRVVLLWAAAKVPGLLEAERQKALVEEILGKQQADGGWSLSTLAGGWKRGDGTVQEVKSDGYATGLITFGLLQAGVPRENARLERGLVWLVENQDRAGGFWAGYSLNKNEEHHILPETALFMRDAATAYAVLALNEGGGR